MPAFRLLAANERPTELGSRQNAVHATIDGFDVTVLLPHFDSPAGDRDSVAYKATHYQWPQDQSDWVAKIAKDGKTVATVTWGDAGPFMVFDADGEYRESEYGNLEDAIHTALRLVA
jgi:hypothetical protein